jgi:6-phosphogluconolactonase
LPDQERKIVKFGRYFLGLAFILVMAILSCCVAAAQGNDYFMYFGTYTGFKFVSQSLTHGVGDSRSQGIYVSRLNSTTGDMGEPELAAKVVNPAFLPSIPIITSCTRLLRIRFQWGRRSTMPHT